MKIDLIGSGGREAAIKWKLEKDGHVVTNNYPDLAFVGPEAPLANGIVDRYQFIHTPIVGPNRLAARLESSKLWAKQFMQRWDIPTARWLTYTRNPEGMTQALLDLDAYRNDRPHKIVSIDPLNLENEYYPVVIKEDGLCGGKGVVIAKSKQEAWSNIPHIFINNRYKSPSNKVLFEDFIPGFEASCFVMSDGDTYKVLPYCKDYKRLEDGDKGPNTGGMGAIAPHPLVTDKMKKIIENSIIKPTLNGMRLEGLKYKGILYIGLMINETGPYVIEYNVRFGDPECQVLMMLMEDDLAPYLMAMAKGGLEDLPEPKFYEGSAITVSLCSQGYPTEYKIDHIIKGLENVNKDVQVFHAATEFDETAQKFKTKGGRVLNVTALGEMLDKARGNVYNEIDKICFDNIAYRKDIGEEYVYRNKDEVERRNKRHRGRSNTEKVRTTIRNKRD
mgnify:CR=1 FL=1